MEIRSRIAICSLVPTERSANLRSAPGETDARRVEIRADRHAAVATAGQVRDALAHRIDQNPAEVRGLLLLHLQQGLSQEFPGFVLDLEVSLPFPDCVDPLRRLPRLLLRMGAAYLLQGAALAQQQRSVDSRNLLLGRLRLAGNPLHLGGVNGRLFREVRVKLCENLPPPLPLLAGGCRVLTP